MICKQIEYRTKSGEREYPTKLTLPDAAATFVKAVALRCDKEMNDAIEGTNLLEKDFRKHKTCYKNYTSIVAHEGRKVDISEKCDPYGLVRKAIKETVLQEQRCMSLDSLMDLKGIKVKNNLSRRNMKAWISRNYGEKILFLTSDNDKDQIIMSKESLESVGKGEKFLPKRFRYLLTQH